MPSSSQAPSNLAHNRENRLQSDLCFLMRLGSYTQPSFPVIMAIPVWTQSAQAAAAVCWKCRIHVLKKTLCGNALCAELRNFKSGDMFFSFSSLLQFPRLCFGDEWVWDCNALSSQRLQWVKKKNSAHCIFLFAGLFRPSLCWSVYNVFLSQTSSKQYPAV